MSKVSDRFWLVVRIIIWIVVLGLIFLGIGGAFYDEFWGPNAPGKNQESVAPDTPDSTSGETDGNN